MYCFDENNIARIDEKDIEFIDPSFLSCNIIENLKLHIFKSTGLYRKR